MAYLIEVTQDGRTSFMKKYDVVDGTTRPVGNMEFDTKEEAETEGRLLEAHTGNPRGCRCHVVEKADG